MRIKNTHFCIYFGDASDGLQEPYHLNVPSQPLLSLDSFQKLKELLLIQELFFLNHEHSNNGVVINRINVNTIIPFKKSGDYLITNVSNVGIGIMSTDCLPVIITDNVNKVVAVIHAGWRGALAQVALKALDRMSKEFGTYPANCAVFFGPSAKECCYTVGAEFEGYLAAVDGKHKILIKRNNNFYFDTAMLCQLQLEAAGVPKNAFDTSAHTCTICDDRFYSYRRLGFAGQQMTVACVQN